MTIIVGFPAKGWVVLAADSDESAGLIKSSVRKIAAIDKGDCKCIVGGSGSGDFIDLAVQHIEERLESPYTLSGVKELIEEVVTDIYTDRIDKYPEEEQRDLQFELLCGIWVRGEPQKPPQLIRVFRGAHLVRTSPESIGVGSYLARYLIATLGENKQQDWAQAVRLAVYLVAQVKQHAQYCGGHTHVINLDSTGTISRMTPDQISAHERSAGVVLQTAATFLFYTTDPFVSDDARIDSAVDFAANKLKAALKSMRPQSDVAAGKT